MAGRGDAGACLKTFPDFLASNENPRVISTFWETMQIWKVGFACVDNVTVENERIKSELSQAKITQVLDSQ
jgi:hypothetical protein